MKWSYNLAMSMLVAVLATGCGSSTGDNLVLQFLGFSSVTENGDSIGQTLAEVDIGFDICADDTPEPFFQTQATATFVNHEGADIVIREIDIDTSAAGLQPIHRDFGSSGPVVIGGRCTNNPSQQCALDSDCSLGGFNGTCERTQSTVEFLLFSFDDKALLRPGTFSIPITFFGVDSSNSDFTVRTVMTVTFEDFNHCGQ